MNLEGPAEFVTGGASGLGRPPVDALIEGPFARLVTHVIANPYLNGEVIRLDGALRLGATRYSASPARQHALLAAVVVSLRVHASSHRSSYSSRRRITR